MNKTGIIFDFNGTMVFDGPKHVTAWKEFAVKLRGQEFSDEEMSWMHGKTNQKIIEYLKPDISLEENNRLSKEKEALYREICMRSPEDYMLVNGLENLLNELKELQIPIIIASASIKDNIDFFIKTFKLDRWFDTDVIVYDDGSYNNKVAMFQEAAKRLHCDIHDCIVIEDSKSGIQCARECHVKAIAAICNPESEADLHFNDYTNIHAFDLLKLSQ